MKKTEIIPIYDPTGDAAGVCRAAELLRQGGLVAIPTETVYGLAADAFNPRAVQEVYAAKGRPSDNPMIVHIAELAMLEQVASSLPENALRLAEAFWPGPLTMVLPKTERVPAVTTGGLESVAVRMPSDGVARAIIRQAATPLAAPSANRSGSPSPTTCRHCIDDLWGRVDAIVESHDCTVGVESTVVSLCGDVPVILRPGAVTPEQLRHVVGEVTVADAVLHMLPEDAAAPSPGMKYKHYSPNARLQLVHGSQWGYIDYVNRKAEEARLHGEEAGIYAMCFDEDIRRLEVPTISYGVTDDYALQAAQLFDVLRQLDKLGAKTVYVHAPEPEEIGLAVYNRLLRAAAFDVVEL